MLVEQEELWPGLSLAIRLEIIGCVGKVSG